MHPRVKDLETLDDYKLKLFFENGEIKIFDVRPFLEKGIFKELRDKELFKNVKVFLGSVKWQNGQDFCPDTLYIEAKSQNN